MPLQELAGRSLQEDQARLCQRASRTQMGARLPAAHRGRAHHDVRRLLPGLPRGCFPAPAPQHLEHQGRDDRDQDPAVLRAEADMHGTARRTAGSCLRSCAPWKARCFLAGAASRLRRTPSRTCGTPCPSRFACRRGIPFPTASPRVRWESRASPCAGCDRPHPCSSTVRTRCQPSRPYRPASLLTPGKNTRSNMSLRMRPFIT